MGTNIPATSKKRVVVIGGGFAGLNLAKSLVRGGDFQTVMIDKLNYHQFQPLLYQVATSGLEPSAISFPLRKDFQGVTDFHFRLATVRAVDPAAKIIDTSIGTITYDYLVVATGTETNYFGMEKIRSAALPMKSVPEALALRNHLLENFERATTSNDPQQQSLLTIVIVGGGATGVEIAGAIAEMKRYILQRDYPELDISKVRIILIEGSDKLLRNMSGESSAKSRQFLKSMGVEVWLDSSVADYDNGAVILKNGDSIPTQTLIWVSGVTGCRLDGIPPECYGRGSRLITDQYNALSNGMQDIFAIGDIALQVMDNYPGGHPQVAQVAIQQGELLARNLRQLERGQSLTPFRYNDMGSMATVGRNKAVVDLNKIKFQGYFAWLVWMAIHLRSILGTKNKILTLINWSWSYITYDQSLRLIIRPDEQDRPTKGGDTATATDSDAASNRPKAES